LLQNLVLACWSAFLILAFRVTSAWIVIFMIQDFDHGIHSSQGSWSLDHASIIL
jgi:hypothetical protein